MRTYRSRSLLVDADGDLLVHNARQRRSLAHGEGRRRRRPRRRRREKRRASCHVRYRMRGLRVVVSRQRCRSVAPSFPSVGCGVDIGFGGRSVTRGPAWSTAGGMGIGAKLSHRVKRVLPAATPVFRHLDFGVWVTDQVGSALWRGRQTVAVWRGLDWSRAAPHSSADSRPSVSRCPPSSPSGAVARGEVEERRWCVSSIVRTPVLRHRASSLSGGACACACLRYVTQSVCTSSTSRGHQSAGTATTALPVVVRTPAP